MTEYEQLLFEYLQNIYPYGIRQAHRNEDSLVYKYDVVRVTTIAVLRENIVDAAANLIVQTASGDGLNDWEEFLNLPIDPPFSDSVRRGVILTRLAGYDATIQSILTVARSVVGGDETNVTIRELYDVSGTTPDDVWTYEVIIQLPVTEVYDPVELKGILENIHPAHCTIGLVVVFDPPFIWADADAPVDPSDWADEDTSPTEPIWSAVY